MNGPSPNGGQTGGRDAQGRFAQGNPGGPGNPWAADVGRLRKRFLRSIRGADIDLAVRTIREVMTSGKDADRLAAAERLLNRVLGLPGPSDVFARIEALEQAQVEDRR